jgi:hypothetical protein
MRRVLAVFIFLLFVMPFVSADTDTASAEPKFTMDDYFKCLPFKNASWKTKVTVESEGNTDDEAVEKVALYTLKGKKLRMDANTVGVQPGNVVYMYNNYIYVYNEERNVALRYSFENPMNPMRASLLSQSSARNKAVKNGAETVNSVACDIYQYDFTRTLFGAEVTSHVKEWRAHSGFTMKTVTETDPYTSTALFVGGDHPASKSTSESYDLDTKTPIADADVTVPDGAAMQDMDKEGGFIGALFNTGTNANTENDGSGDVSGTAQDSGNEAAPATATDTAKNIMNGVINVFGR